MIITNIVCKSHCKCAINLSLINEPNLRSSNRFPGIAIKYNEGTVLLFNSGYYSISGVKNLSDAKLIAKRLITMLRNYGFNANLSRITIINICASDKMPFRIDLIKFANNDKNCSYETELFPGAKCLFNGYIFTVFHTGTVFVTGFKNYEEINRQFKLFKRYLLNYKKYT